MTRPDHPNEPGKWTRLAAEGGRALWRRERADPYPVVQFYLLAPPHQTEVFYDEVSARTRYDALASTAANQSA